MPIPAGQRLTRPFYTRLLASDDIHDSDGRPLGEKRATARAREGVAIEMRTCPYSGARKGLPMNVSALKQMTQRWPEILAGLGELHRGYLGHLGRGVAADWSDIVGISTACIALPIFLFDRARAPIDDGALPATLGAIYKVAAGAHGLLRRMAEQHLAHPEEPRWQDWSAGRVIAAGEGWGSFSAGGEACAGPPQLLDEAMGVMLMGGAARGEPLIDDPVRFFESCVCATDTMWLATVLERIDRLAERHVLEGFAALPTPPGLLAERALAQLEGLRHGQDLAGLPRIVRGSLGYCRRLDPERRARVEDTLAALAPDGAAQTVAPESLRPVATFLRSSPAALVTTDAGVAWLSEEIVAYAVGRVALQAALQALEVVIGAQLERPPAPVTTSDSQLFGRLHANAWLEVVAGCRIDIDGEGFSLKHRGGELRLPVSQLAAR